jgi:hypothetical protein
VNLIRFFAPDIVGRPVLNSQNFCLIKWVARATAPDM